MPRPSSDRAALLAAVQVDPSMAAVPDISPLNWRRAVTYSFPIKTVVEISSAVNVVSMTISTSLRLIVISRIRIHLHFIDSPYSFITQ